MARTPLRETAVIKLNGSGAGTAKVGPLSAREIWYPDNVHIGCATDVKESTCDIFVGRSATDENFRDQSVLGSSGDSSGTVGGDVVKCGDYIWAKWLGGDANVQAVLTVTGVRDV
jgi:hypothetical protein